MLETRQARTHQNINILADVALRVRLHDLFDRCPWVQFLASRHCADEGISMISRGVATAANPGYRGSVLSSCDDVGILGRSNGPTLLPGRCNSANQETGRVTPPRAYRELAIPHDVCFGEPTNSVQFTSNAHA